MSVEWIVVFLVFKVLVISIIMFASASTTAKAIATTIAIDFYLFCSHS